MALTGAMSAGLSGLKAHMNALNVVGNNVANVNTQGYKPGRVTFMESIYSTQSAGSAGTATVGGTNPQQTGYGVGIGTIDLDMSSQALDATGRGGDCAIQGDGFFLVGDKSHNIDSMDDVKGLTLTRVGNFEFRDGYLTDGQGNVVYGFITQSGADTPGTALADKPSTVLVPIRLPMKSTDPNSKGDAVYVGVSGDGDNVYPDPNDPAANVDGFVDWRTSASTRTARSPAPTRTPAIRWWWAISPWAVWKTSTVCSIPRALITRRATPLGISGWAPLEIPSPET